MKNYQEFQLDDFLLDESFNRWARQESPPEEWTFWEEWLTQHPDKREIAEQARLIITGLDVKPYRDIPEEEIHQQFRQIQLRTHQQQPLRLYRSNWFSWASAAAVFLLVLGIGWVVWTRQQRPKEPVYAQLIQDAPTALIEKVNTGQTPLSVRLSDGSQVVLQPASRISFSRRFDGAKREVYLTGEAFFNVRKNPRQPFYVYANDIVTKVLGTSFIVRSFENQANGQVIVRTGRVSVFAHKDWQRAEKAVNSDVPGVVLTPNQQVVFNRQEGHFHRTLTPDPVIVDPHFASHIFDYDETPVTKVFAQLEAAYGVDIVFDEQLLKQCTLTARFKDEPLLEKLNLICHTIKASYQIVDAQIIINAQGCY